MMALERWLQWSNNSGAVIFDQFGRAQIYGIVLRQTMRELSALCKLLLLGGPGVLSLATTVGFRPDTGFTVVNISSVELPYISDETVAQAWKILDVLEAADSDSSNASDMQLGHMSVSQLDWLSGLDFDRSTMNLLNKTWLGQSH